MNTRALYAAMVELGLSMSQARARYREALGALPERLAASPLVDVPGIGTFIGRVYHHPAREGVNPFTRQPITWRARTSTRIYFEPDGALVGAISTATGGAPAPQSADLLHQAFASVLIRSGVLHLAGVGSFRVIKRPALKARAHPRTGAIIKPAMPASRDVRFRPTSKLKAALLSGAAGGDERA